MEVYTHSMLHLCSLHNAGLCFWEATGAQMEVMECMCMHPRLQVLDSVVQLPVFVFLPNHLVHASLSVLLLHMDMHARHLQISDYAHMHTAYARAHKHTRAPTSTQYLYRDNVLPGHAGV
mmetsp:Transcript_76923/g.112635  ORF Transcript_76923/g.112635 Transcript_76923/m.112635 type:complete len:120 (-) Transcript_76923:471-830(-)